MFLAKEHYSDGPGFGNLEYGLIAEQLGKSCIASEVSVNSTTDCMDASFTVISH